MGITFGQWQSDMLACTFGKTRKGRYAASSGVALSICRQTGKTYALGRAMLLQCAARPGLTVLWTAHHTRTATDTFNGMVGVMENKLPAFLGQVRRANGQQEIGFANGSRILFGAREQGFGRGFSGVDFEVFDEAQILSERAMDDMVPAMNAAPNPLLVLMGTPPTPSDPSDVFRDMRRRALSKADGVMYVEFSADRDAKADDRRAWAQANPSYPSRTGEGAMIRMMNTLSADSFRREALGIWDETAALHGIDPAAWAGAEAGKPPEGAVPSLGIDMPPDRSAVSVGVCWRSGDHAHVELARYIDASKPSDLLDWVAARWPRLAAVVIDAQSPAMGLVPDLAERHVKVTITGARDMSRACGRLVDMLSAGTLTHTPDGDAQQLAAAVAGVTRRPVGLSGQFAWNKAASDVDISPVVACTLALHGAWNSKRDPTRRQIIGGF